MGTQTRFDEFLIDWQLDFIPSSRESAALAGASFSRHVTRGGRKGRVVAHFLIAEHVQVHTDRPIARDRGYLHDYFEDLTVLDPTNPLSAQETGAAPRPHALAQGSGDICRHMY